MGARVSFGKGHGHARPGALDAKWLGELGCLGSLETGQAGEEDGIGAEGTLDHSQLLTDPEEAADFVDKTGVDALAIAIGTSHGAYKFTRPPTGDPFAPRNPYATPRCLREIPPLLPVKDGAEGHVAAAWYDLPSLLAHEAAP